MARTKAPAAAKPATIADIARACGVSRWTVSAALFPSEKNRHVGCSDETRDAIHAAAAKLRYRPHRASRDLLGQRKGVVGILTTRFHGIPWHSIHAMLQTAARNGQVISFESFAAGDGGGELPLFIREQVVDGLIVYEPLAPATDRAIAHHRIPVVRVNTGIRGLPASIIMDEADAIARIVAHLAEGRRRQVALIVGTGEAPYERERIAALTTASRRHGLAAPLVLTFPGATHEPPQGADRLRGFLDAHPGCDAVIAPHDAFVWMLSTLCRRTGRRIPDDLAVVCMQNPDRLLHHDPPVTAVDLPEVRLGQLAVELLNRLLAGEKRLGEVVLPYELLARGSTAPRPG